MKIVCEACGAKYSIADDRVAGKVFKIRCKRCSEVIVVRGDQPEAAAPAQAAAGATYDDQSAIWHVVVDGEQAGPYA
ncbi:MAG TPA: zinc-ribbon domain-containing protein, partial [Polyangiales bacterium]|nr:zinc-ribbon domain-containing protein [Polyangiales bacterium]